MLHLAYRIASGASRVDGAASGRRTDVLAADQPSSHPEGETVQTSTSSIEIRHLRYFLADAEDGSFTRAATLLHIAQPPLSAQIRQLERRVGGQLFVRGKGPIQLTDAGHALLDFAYTAVGAIRRGLTAAQAAGSSACTTLR